VKTRNVTIALDEDTVRWLRVEAARQDTSISKLVASVLRRHIVDDREYEPAMRGFLARPARPLKTQPGYPSRNDLHERADLR